MSSAAGKRPPLVARLLIAGSCMMSLASSISVPFLAIFLHRELGLCPGLIGFVVGCSVFFAIAAGFVGGSLSDLLGRTRMLLLSLLGMVAAFVGFYFSRNLVTVFACNATLAMSNSSFGPIAKALLSDLLPQERRVRWFSHQYLAVNIGFAVGPILGAFAGLSGGRAAYLAGALGCLLYCTLLGGAFVLNRTVLQGTLGSGAQVDGRRVGQVVRGLGDSFRAVVLDRRLRYFIVAGLCLETVYSKTAALLAQHLSIGFADGARTLGYLLTANAITVVIFQIVASRYAEKREPAFSIVVGCGLLFGGMMGFAIASQAWQFVVAMVVFSIGETFIVPAEFALIDRIALEDRRGSYFGAQTFSQLGGFVGPFTGGLILTHWGGSAMFTIVGCFALCGALIYTVTGRRLPRRTQEKEESSSRRA